jgi:hypothetical protein
MLDHNPELKLVNLMPLAPNPGNMVWQAVVPNQPIPQMGNVSQVW